MAEIKYTCMYCGNKTSNTNSICITCEAKLDVIRKIRKLGKNIKESQK